MYWIIWCPYLLHLCIRYKFSVSASHGIHFIGFDFGYNVCWKTSEGTRDLKKSGVSRLAGTVTNYCVPDRRTLPCVHPLLRLVHSPLWDSGLIWWQQTGTCKPLDICDTLVDCNTIKLGIRPRVWSLYSYYFLICLIKL